MKEPVRDPKRVIRKLTLMGIAIVVLLVGGIGTWAATTQLTGAVIAPGTLVVDGKQVAQGRIEHTVAVRFTMSVETFDIGEDTGTPVNLSYDVPFKFTGQIDSGRRAPGRPRSSRCPRRC